MKKSILILGAGGHARVCADAIQAAGGNVTAFLETDDSLVGKAILGIPIIGQNMALENGERDQTELIIGIGSAGRFDSLARRQEISANLAAKGWSIGGVRHPSAIISSTANVAFDAQLMARSVVQPQATIGSGAIINTAAVVEHDAVVGDGSHVSIGAILGGNVTLGRNVFVGAGGIVRQGVVIGDNVVIGAGATVIRNQQFATTLVGVPARELSTR